MPEDGDEIHDMPDLKAEGSRARPSAIPGKAIARINARGTGVGAAAPCWVWGLPLSPLSMAEAIGAIDALIVARAPSLILSANLNYAMLSDADPALVAINRGAALVLGDGMPLVWASRLSANPLPERVAGSDLIFEISKLAARRGYRVFLLGGEPGVAERAAANLSARYPGFLLAGIESPPFGPTTPEDDAALVARIRATDADILFMASTQPRGEKWLAQHLDALRVPACMQVGASLDFAAGRVRRSPVWLQRIGLEWAFRLTLEPGRLARRYLSNAIFLLRVVLLGPAPAATDPRLGGRP